MTWINQPIDGQQSVAANKAPINSDFQYIFDKMQRDHFWNDGNNEQAGDIGNEDLDGHHAFVQMPKFVDPGTTDPANPTIDDSMDGIYYMKQKTTTEAPDGPEVVEPFYFVNDGALDQILQLGFRALVNFEGRNSNGDSVLHYTHNVTTVERSAQGVYKLLFQVDMPSTNYMVFVGGMLTGANTRCMLGSVSSTNTHGDFVKQESVVLTLRSTDNTLADPLRAWVAVVGG